MKRVAFKMKLFQDCFEEYKKRHNEIWPELVALLKQRGITDYQIHFDVETNTLFATYQVSELSNLDDLSVQPIMQKWWEHMADIMETNNDQSPVCTPLDEVFYLS